ncbi:hypothetical protein [Streptomyces alboniger]|uniref:Uncharacterized protein n=1 Tax=Streptomyces alboniger TaxID=132473 RepID=A0A5J6HRW0_STRAD|nr:hypothetical protein [Streptomyces alboniger]QEV21594.1 hypothetical protein CP975_32325 [Streptomyces alboniger]
MTTTPTPHQSPRMPGFTAGSADVARRRARDVAAMLAGQYAAHGAFTVPGLFGPDDLVAVPEGALVFVDEVGDLAGDRPGYRLHAVPVLLSNVQEALGWRDAEDVEDAFEAAVETTGWGALALIATSRASVGVSALRTRLTTLLRCWEELAGLRYVDFAPAPVTLSELVGERCAGLTAMWLPDGAATGDPRRDLPTALDALEGADEETRTARSLERMAVLADGNPRIRHLDATTEPDLLREELDALEPREREAIAAGFAHPALAVLYAVDRSHEPHRR